MTDNAKAKTPKKGRATPPRPNARRELGNRRPAGELKCTLKIIPPDAEKEGDEPVEIHVDLRRFSLAERQLVKRVLDKMTAVDLTEAVLVHAWVVWLRTHPKSKMNNWMAKEYGDVLDAIDIEPGHTDWNTTPDGFDPEG